MTFDNRACRASPDLQDAVKYMDGEKIDGQKVNVSRAEGRPPIRSGPGGPKDRRL